MFINRTHTFIFYKGNTYLLTLIPEILIWINDIFAVIHKFSLKCWYRKLTWYITWYKIRKSEATNPVVVKWSEWRRLKRGGKYELHVWLKALWWWILWSERGGTNGERDRLLTLQHEEWAHEGRGREHRKEKGKWNIHMGLRQSTSTADTSTKTRWLKQHVNVLVLFVPEGARGQRNIKDRQRKKSKESPVQDGRWAP